MDLSIAIDEIIIINTMLLFEFFCNKSGFAYFNISYSLIILLKIHLHPIKVIPSIA